MKLNDHFPIHNTFFSFHYVMDVLAAEFFAASHLLATSQSQDLP